MVFWGQALIKYLPLFVGLKYFASGGRNNRLVSFISLLALSGLSLGVGLLIVVLSVMNGFDREMREHILSVVPHIQIIAPEALDEWHSHQDLIATIPNVVEVTPFKQVDGVIFTQNDTRPIQLMGLDSLNVPEGLGTVIEQANLTIPADGELLLAKPIADSLKLKSGSRINIILPSDGNRRAKVTSLVLAGVFATRTEVDQMLGIISLNQAAIMTSGKGSIDGYRVQVDDLFQASLVGHRIISQLPYGFRARDWTQSYGNLFQAIHLSRNMVSLLVFLIVGIAAFNIISMLMMMVINKRKDIAILQTMGASKKQILQIFLIQGSLIATAGIFFGVTLGLIGCFWVADLVAVVENILGSQLLNTSIYPIDYVPVDLRWHDVVYVVLAAFILTLLATLYPAIKASKTVPAEALRYQS
jgi:lipoprotein-releasing system permease protein